MVIATVEEGIITAVEAINIVVAQVTDEAETTAMEMLMPEIRIDAKKTTGNSPVEKNQVAIVNGEAAKIVAQRRIQISPLEEGK